VLGAIGKTERVAQESVTVYQIVKDGKVTYVGITNNLVRRSAEHGEYLEKVATLPSRDQARAVEQALIQHHGFERNGGTLTNRINSISPTNPGFKDAVIFGFEVLRTLGHIF
jgi:hypothetical protein